MAKILVTFEHVDLGEIFECTSGEICVKVGWSYGCELQYEQESDPPSIFNFGQEAGVYVFREPKKVRADEIRSVGTQYRTESGEVYIFTYDQDFLRLKGPGMIGYHFDAEDLPEYIFEEFPECCVVEE